jgi:branched-chain amino acid transport system permease protein
MPGITTGCVYALVALGFVLCANVSGLINFAQGEFAMIGGLLAAWMVGHAVPLPVAVLASVGAGALLGALQERLTFAPVQKSPAFIQITITFGVAAIMRGIALILFGKDPVSMPGFSGDGIIELAGAVLPVQALWVWGTTAALFAVTFLFLYRTRTGRAVRACSTNPAAARLMGIDTSRLGLLVFGASGAAGALAGVVSAPIVLAGWSTGLDFGLKGFIGAIIGGFRSPFMAVAGGLGIGIVEALAAGYISSSAKDVIAYGVLLAYLLYRGRVFARGRHMLSAKPF